VFFTDVDLAYDPDEALKILSPVGVRALTLQSPMRARPDSQFLISPRSFPTIYRRHLMSRGFNWWLRQMLPITILDTQAGLKGITAQAWNVLGPQITTDGFFFDVSWLARAGVARMRIAERRFFQIPVDPPPCAWVDAWLEHDQGYNQAAAKIDGPRTDWFADAVIVERIYRFHDPVECPPSQTAPRIPFALGVTADDFGIGVDTAAESFAHTAWSGHRHQPDGDHRRTRARIRRAARRCARPRCRPARRADGLRSSALVAGRSSGLVGRDGRFLSNGRLWRRPSAEG